MGDLNYLDSEESLRLALHGGDTLFGESLPQNDDSEVGVHINQTETSAIDPKFAETVRLYDAAQSEHKLMFLEQVSPRLSSFLRDRVSHPLRDNADSGVSIFPPLCVLVRRAFLPIKDEDVGLLESRCRVCSIKHESKIWNRVSSGRPRLSSFSTVGPMCVLMRQSG